MDHSPSYHQQHHHPQHPPPPAPSLSYSRQQNLFPHKGQLPPPSSLNLPMPSLSRSNTLPPLNHLSQDARYPPHSYHPSLASPSHSHNLPSPSSSAHSASTSAAGPGPWSTHRTSSSRDEIHPNMRRRESKSGGKPNLDLGDAYRDPPLQQQSQPGRSQVISPQAAPDQKDGGGDDGMTATSDFVKKLYKMLEDQSFQHVVSWNAAGDAFVVKDMNDFTKSILPRMFKHSNFASFVRQLNKYDFHKVKNSDDAQTGEQSWTFRHPDFQIDRVDALENIKRKVPAQRKGAAASAPLRTSTHSNSPGVSPASFDVGDSPQIQALQAQVDRLSTAHDEMAQHIRHLENDYQSVLGEMVNFQRNMAQQDGLMQNLIQYFLQLENAKIKDEQQRNSMVNGASTSGMGNGSNANNAPRSAGGAENNGGTFADQNPFLAAREAQRMVKNYPDDDVGRQSLEQLNEISRRATVAGMNFSNTNGRPGTPARVLAGLVAQGQQNQADRQRRTSTSPRQQQQQQAGSPSRQDRTQQNQEQDSTSGESNGANADVVNLNLSREDALQRIEELARARPSSAQGDANGVIGPLGPIGLGGGLGMGGVAQGQVQLPPVQYASGNEPFIMPGNDVGLGGGAMDAYGNTNGSMMGMGANAAMGNHALTHSGLQVFTLGHLMPRSATEDDTSAVWNFDARGLTTGNASGQQNFQQQQGSGVVDPYGGLGEAQAGPSTNIGDFASSSAGSVDAGGSAPMVSSSRLSGPSSSSSGSSQKLRVRRSTFVPGWAVPPRVLLVDDDAVSRKLSSKFLQVFGCTIDVAVDGVVAVNKMNLERYDLVLMDIVMPKLDGVSATSLIRQFDHMTPIISMTSNSKPNEIMTYYSHGMNDILPKPFTKEGLLSMLEKHLTHLKTIKELSRIPRSVGIPPLSDESFNQALVVSASNTQQQALLPPPSAGDDEGAMTKINPLAGLGLSDDEYAQILHGMINGENFNGLDANFALLNGAGAGVVKRGLEDAEERNGKRSRFEEVE